MLNRRKFIERATSAAAATLATGVISLGTERALAAHAGGRGEATSRSGAWFENGDLPWVRKLSQPQYEIQFEYNVKTLVMRDGVKMAANIWRPKAEGKFPVIYMQTPYDKSSE